MRILEIVIENVRGLPYLNLKPNGDTLVIWGPNGAGKSGVVDAIDFVLTGRISRLVGAGTLGITLRRHGAHIDHDPESAVVTATIQLEGFTEAIVIRRCIASPDNLDCPDEAKEQLVQISEIVRRGGMILTRRDILNFVTADAGTRADQIQQLMNLADIDEIRDGFIRARTELRRKEQAAKVAIGTAKAEVNVTLRGDQYSDEHLMEVLNECRAVLSGPPLDSPESQGIKNGLEPQLQIDAPQSTFNRTLFEGVLENIKQGTRPEIAVQVSDAEVVLRRLLDDVKADEDSLSELKRLALTQQALGFIDKETTDCPVCGAIWPEGHLHQHLEAKLETAKAAAESQTKIAQGAELIAVPIRTLSASLVSLVDTLTSTKLKEKHEEDTESLTSWKDDLDRLLEALGSPLDKYLEGDFNASSVAKLFAPDNLSGLLTNLALGGKSYAGEPSKEQTAWDTLTKLGESVRAVENRTHDLAVSALQHRTARIRLEEYEKARDSVLQELYDRISGRFVELYGVLHEHEKDRFSATLQPDGPSLKFEVDFLGRGAHPPHALHSEGHQDSMGLCLFLALNEELSMGQTGIIVLDDVVMSVDIGHRKDVCRLLTEIFPDRQFLITTHDRQWAKQLRSEQVVKSPNLIEFTDWTIETGPRVHHQLELWEAIEEDLRKENVHDAAFKLRRGSEDFFESVCDALSADITYNSANQWELGDYLLSAMDRFRTLLGRARSAAISWSESGAEESLNELDSIRSQIYSRTFAEQWPTNTLVHYNAWENMGKEDFSPVVDAFRDLCGLFLCTSCARLIEAVPRDKRPEVFKCPCGKVNWNLKHRPSG